MVTSNTVVNVLKLLYYYQSFETKNIFMTKLFGFRNILSSVQTVQSTLFNKVCLVSSFVLKYQKLIQTFLVVFVENVDNILQQCVEKMQF